MTSMTNKSFFDYSREIAQGFLQTVVAIDDNMSFKPRPIEIDELIEPEDDAVFGVNSGADNVSEKPTGPITHELYYQTLSSAFAKKSIVCSGFTPLTDPAETTKVIVNTSKNADITILDWQMDGTEKVGELATRAIIDLANNDINEGGRLRLISIYTGEEIENIIFHLTASLEKEFNPVIVNSSIIFKDKKLSHWKIDVISKDTNEEELTIKLIDSFAHLTSGLLSNAALSMIADIRDKTHNILHKFNKTLDPAYLSHVLGLISSPDMREQAHEVAFDYAVDLLTEELKSELQTSNKVKSSLSKVAIQSWPSYINSDNEPNYFWLMIGEDCSKFDTDKMNRLLSELNTEQLEDLLENGLGIKYKDKNTPISRFAKETIQLTIANDDKQSLFELCAIESARRDVTTIGSHMPVLKQGTVLRRKDTGKYFICVQPLCDSVRLKGSSSFSLMKISKHKKEFTHILRNSTGHLKLQISPTPKNIRTYYFDPDLEKKSVRAIEQNDSLIFTGKHEGNENIINFEWCGEFKQTISQAIVNGLAAQLSRVGFDTFEWLRLKRPN